jgi:S-adenosylmethionine:tRNA ribosyltransferase-isomerase
VRVLAHPRLIEMRFQASVEAIWEGLARHGRPIQYAHLSQPLEIWDTWTRVASQPVAFEPPSASFILDWAMIQLLRSRRARFATLTHAAGISSTGDPDLDRLLPFDEPYHIPPSTAALIATNRGRGRVIAIGTTVVRALEHAARPDGTIRSGNGIATERVGPLTQLRVVDAIVSGVHEQGTSHYELLRAFQDGESLERMESEAEARGYRRHEFGDSVFLERSSSKFLEAVKDAAPNCEAQTRLHNQLFLDLLAEDSWRRVYTGELEVRPPGAPTTRPDEEALPPSRALSISPRSLSASAPEQSGGAHRRSS